MEGVFYMQSSTFGRLCITQRIDLRGTYTCPKKEVHYKERKKSKQQKVFCCFCITSTSHILVPTFQQSR